MADALTEILRAASKHPNSRVSKLIHTVEEEPSQKNIVLLLIELAEHTEYSTDFNVSLKYYLNLFERLGIDHDLVLNEAGLLLVNSSKIYSKRVDYVQSLVERQILTLSNADDELQKQKLEQQKAENAATPTEKPKRGHKRALEAPSDPYEVELVPKKFKKLNEEKRFAQPKAATKAKLMQRNIEMEQHIHPAGWLHAAIYDFENEEDIDTKRNYKLFTYHVEHRYNTLVPDINFRLHFKVKDYMDEQEEMEEDEACNTDRSWPPLSEAYVEKYLRLENYVLQQDVKAATKSKAAEIEDDDGNDANDSNLGETTQILNDSNLAEANKTLNITDNQMGNDSALGTSLLDESNNAKNDTTIAANGNLDPQNLNDANATEANKSLVVVTEQQTVNDSALGISILDQTGNTENNATSGSMDTINMEQVNETTSEADKLLNVTEAQIENDSALGTSVLDETCNTTNENLNNTSNSLALNDATNTADEKDKSSNITETQTENDSALGTNVLVETCNTTNENLDNTTKSSLSLTTTDEEEVNNILKTTETQPEKEYCSKVLEEDKSKSEHPEGLIKVTENRKDSALSDNRHHSISTENLAMSTENLYKLDELMGKPLDINLKEHDKDKNLLRIHLPHTDDEGVYLSDIEENDCHLLSPIITATNILPGVKRKDVTIFMDDELRQALEMRDSIMEHFGHETYKVPVITEQKKENLIFNILKLPEKIVRRKVIFKLGPEMDLYLQARSLKRIRPAPETRSFRITKLLEWFSLNNTNMTGIVMIPPTSPEHCSDFCGFSDHEDDNVDDDTISCDDFCGFTEEEQTPLTVKQISRLSRDSGVGVDVNNLTPEKETLEIIFEEPERENCKRNLNVDETTDNAESSTQSILNELSEEIREVLTIELEGESQTNTEAATKSCTEAAEPHCSDNNREETEKMNTESSLKDSEAANNSSNNTHESKVTPTESYSETPTIGGETVPNTEESLTTNESQDNSSENVKKSEERPNDANDLLGVGDELPSENMTECNKSCEELLKEKLNLENSLDTSDDHFEDNNNDDSYEDDVGELLDLDAHGSKTKIQQWHEHLQPILAKSRERHHFDVFKLGTEIIDTVQNRISNDESVNEFKTSTSPPAAASFYDIMANKEQSYVSRYFLSTLLLANQSNIEISIYNQTSEKPSSWHDIHLKLLSTKRHTVAIEDNIGMIGKKVKAQVESNLKEKPSKNSSGQTKTMTTTTTTVDEEEDEDEPIAKRQQTKASSLKRSNDNVLTATIAEKKLKEANNRLTELPYLIENVQIIKPATAQDLKNLPSTSRQAQHTNNTCNAYSHINTTTIRTLQPIEKVQQISDDYDSGIFSLGEMSTS